MNRPGNIWLTLFALGVAYETYAVTRKRHEATLSHITRILLHTDTRPGRAIFATGWTAFSAWYLAHILKQMDPNTP